MTIAQFKKLAEKRFAYCLDLMVNAKHKEYSRNDDKLYNFKRAGHILNITPEKALAGMLSKHLVSVLDIADESGMENIVPKKLDEKISDAINYLVLLEALIKERQDYL